MGIPCVHVHEYVLWLSSYRCKGNNDENTKRPDQTRPDQTRPDFQRKVIENVASVIKMFME